MTAEQYAKQAHGVFEKAMETQGFPPDDFKHISGASKTAWIAVGEYIAQEIETERELMEMDIDCQIMRGKI